jgi:Transposase DDE domain
MDNALLLNEDWRVLMTMFPLNWRELAKETGALSRQLRSFKDEESIMRTFMLHFANGYSLRETVTRAKVSGLADITDVALLKRLKCSEHWLKELSLSLLRERYAMTKVISERHDICMRLVDGSIVKEPGKTGSQWRVHYSLKLPELECDYFKLTAVNGDGTGESYKQFPIAKNDCIIGDRGYSTSQGIEYVKQKGAYSLVRVNTATLSFYIGNKKEFDLLKKITTLQKEYSTKEWHVKLKNGDEEFIDGRLCVIRKSKVSADIAIAKIIKEATKRQRDIKPSTLEFAKYIIIFTTLPLNHFPLDVVLEWYRARWQVELAFKRLKSLICLGHLPKYDEQSSKAWLYGKLFIGLLVEKLIYYAKNISPWGYELQWENQQSLEGI